jgi:hypothetical protein
LFPEQAEAQLTILIIGLIASTLLYLAAIYALVWAGQRRVKWGAQRGLSPNVEPKFPSVTEIWNRHSVEMTVIYAVVFALLALMDFTIWARLGFAALGALFFGSAWIANSPSDPGLPGSSPAAKRASDFGYWCLAVLDWFGYMSVLCFAGAVVAELF